MCTQEKKQLLALHVIVNNAYDSSKAAEPIAIADANHNIYDISPSESRPSSVYASVWHSAVAADV